MLAIALGLPENAYTMFCFGNRHMAVGVRAKQRERTSSVLEDTGCSVEEMKYHRKDRKRQGHPTEVFRKIGVPQNRCSARVCLLAGKNSIFIRLGKMCRVIPGKSAGKSDRWK